MSDNTTGKRPTSGPPLRREGTRPGQFDILATEDVPEELRRMDVLPSPPPYRLRAVERQALRTTSDEPVVPFRPSWVAGAGRPRRARFPGQPKRKLWHRGAEVDPLFVWGADDRRVYDDTAYPWGCVCRIITASGSGSGVLAGPRHVLTASHVVDWNTSGAGTVEVHRAGPAVSALSAIVAVWSFIKVTSPGPGYSELDEDYAVLITADRIGDRFGWLGVRTYDSGWDDEPLWRNIGYPGDVADGMFPVYQRDQELDEDEWDYGSARAMTTSADVMKGQSGSPMFAFWDDGPYAVAVVSAEGTVVLSGSENWCSGGSDLTRLVNHARASDP